MAGKASGKRTLVEAMEDDIIARKKKLDIERKRRRQSAPVLSSSRFFANVDQPVSGPVAGASRIARDYDMEKENTPPVFPEEMMDHDEDEMEDVVAQEDGYISPSPTLARGSTPEISSPVRFLDDVYAGDEEYSVAPAQPGFNAGRTQDVEELRGQPQEPHIFVRGSSEIQSPSPAVIPGPDLRMNFDDDSDFEKSSEIGTWDEDRPEPGVDHGYERGGRASSRASPQSVGPLRLSSRSALSWTTTGGSQEVKWME